jgi:hypothetical protein
VADDDVYSMATIVVEIIISRAMRTLIRSVLPNWVGMSINRSGEVARFKPHPELPLK